MTLRDYLDRLMQERDVTSNYVRSLRKRVDGFSEYLGRPATLDDLSSENLNAWIARLQQESGWKPKTIKHYQAAVALVWREAFDRGDVDRPPWRLKRLKVPKSVVQAWNLDELRAIIAATKWLRGDVAGTSIWKRDWFRAFIESSYYTGLRRCDLMNHAKRSDLRDGVLTIVECKSIHKVLSRTIPPRTIKWLERVWEEDDGPYILPWPGKLRCFYASFQVLVAHAGVTAGGPHKIRRSAGSYAHAANGNGAALLGHDDVATFHAHYHDRSVTRQIPKLPPEL